MQAKSAPGRSLRHPVPRETLRPRDWLFAAALVVAVFLAYQPAWQGGFIWDDEAHVTRPELRSWHGLYRIWFDLGATQQYYPLLHSAFWLEHKLWGDDPLGYHLVNICCCTPRQPSWWRWCCAAGDSRGVSGGGHLRAASGAGGIGGLDHGTEEHALGRVLPGRHAGLPPLRPNAAAESLYWWRSGCLCWAC